MSNQIFTKKELNEHASTEIELVAKARAGNPNPLFNFWKAKRDLFRQRMRSR